MARVWCRGHRGGAEADAGRGGGGHHPRFRSLQTDQVSEKNPGDLVTVADHESEQLLTEALTAAYPDAVVLGEEAHAEDPGLLDRFNTADHGFTVDPVDGTKNFVNGSPDHAVMIGGGAGR
ncbi:inositol monophosphatase family protein [Nocardioides sp. TF02-7]|uniref:inositol monophosphatase family protein n=1 Tax=Nocardioides sp. TF02-7 TaxID=2917724 RepID=UPI0023D9A4AC|nr:inositol monophosphatase family protein [Nocardioides sp. TF02-7]